MMNSKDRMSGPSRDQNCTNKRASVEAGSNSGSPWPVAPVAKTENVWVYFNLDNDQNKAAASDTALLTGVLQ